MSVKLSVDTLGSETSLSEIMIGLSESSLRYEDYIFYLFGNENLIKKQLEVHSPLIKKVEILSKH